MSTREHDQHQQQHQQEQQSAHHRDDALHARPSISASPSKRSWMVLLLSVVLVLVLMVVPGSAYAGQMTVFSCHDPAGNAVGHDGWSIYRTADVDMTVADSCGSGGQGAMVLNLGANPYGYGNSARTEWVFYAPSWATIASYTLQLADTYAIPSTGSGFGQVFVEASDESDPNYDYRSLGGGTQGAATISRTPPAPVGAIIINTSCDGQYGSCPANQEISHADLTSAQLLLDDSTTPTVSNLTGNLVSATPLRGTAEASFDAQDDGPGIYSGWLTIDGQPLPATVLDSNNGWCQNLGQTSNGTRSFAHPDPCAQSTSASLALDTTSLHDGQYTLKIMVDDASGNTTTAYNATIITDNAPANTTSPTISEPEQTVIGTTLTAQPGTWSAPAGTGSVTYTYQWQDCNTEGASCKTITGAQNATYTVTQHDAGHTLRTLITASDNDGNTSTATANTSLIPAPEIPPPPTPAPNPQTPAPANTNTPQTSPAGTAPSVVPPTDDRGAPNGAPASEAAQLRLAGPTTITRSFAKRAFTITGELLSAQGHPIGAATLNIIERNTANNLVRLIAHALTHADGTFILRVPPGPSRQITVAYRAFTNSPDYAATLAINELVHASLSLTVTKRPTNPHGTLKLTGTVSGPIPHQGAIIYLLVHYRGSWETIRTSRTKPTGHFKLTYQFQGSIGRFPFRVATPGGQANFPYLSGYSKIIAVTAPQ